MSQDTDIPTEKTEESVQSCLNYSNPGLKLVRVKVCD